MSDPEFDERGLRGNSGVFGDEKSGGHIAAPYSSRDDDTVFVAIDGEFGPHWERWPLKEAEEKKAHIILCGIPDCKKYAVSLDHYWPWEGDEFNRCKEHLHKEAK